MSCFTFKKETCKPLRASGPAIGAHLLTSRRRGFGVPSTEQFEAGERGIRTATMRCRAHDMT